VEPERLGRWLGTGVTGEEGSAIKLDLLDGGTLTGRVLADTGREVSLGWSEIDGVLELKAFGAGDSTMVGVRGWGWGLGAEAAAELERRVAPAVGRLAAELR
jgi:hypothetical protein